MTQVKDNTLGISRALGLGWALVHGQLPNKVPVIVPPIVLPPLFISGTPSVATVGQAYTFAPMVTGGSGERAYGFSLTGTLPAGLSFSTASGAVTGTPTQGGVSSQITITVVDALGTMATLTRTISVAAVLEPTNTLLARDGSTLLARDGTPLLQAA
jgi:hypothetical protein